jgi:uncharacterized protein YdaU (DUF1376 family)
MHIIYILGYFWSMLGGFWGRKRWEREKSRRERARERARERDRERERERERERARERESERERERAREREREREVSSCFILFYSFLKKLYTFFYLQAVLLGCAAA